MSREASSRAAAKELSYKEEENDATSDEAEEESHDSPKQKRQRSSSNIPVKDGRGKLKRNRREEDVSADKRRKVTKTEYEAYLDSELNKEMDIVDSSESFEGPNIVRNNLEAGQIREIYMENFMCHRIFKIKLGRHLNFIYGKNGSGKSSIASALQVCFGSSAKTAGRGSNMAEYIREGSAGPAIVRIKLVNEGPDAFKPDIFGKTITVERRIAKASGSCYILFDENDQEVSRRKEDLEKMLQMFNIYVDNPCNVMTQEESKKFIYSKSSDKYTFFLKATGLYHLKEELLSIKANIDEAEQEALKQQDLINAKAAGVNEIHAKLERMRELETMGNKIRLFKAKTYWDDLRAAENKATESTETLETKRDMLEQLVAAHSKLVNSDESKAAEMQELQELIAEIGAELATNNEESAKRQAEFQRAAHGVKLAKAKLTELESAQTDFLKRRKETERNINDLRARAKQGAESDVRKLYEEIEELESLLVDCQAKQSTLHDRRNALFSATHEQQNIVAQASSKVRNTENQIRIAKETLDSLRSGGGDRTAVFGNSIANAVRKVRETTFEGPVIGPLGMNVTIREGFQEYDRVVERALGRLVFAFVATNDRDRLKVQNIITQCNARLSYVISQTPHERYRLRASPPDVTFALDAMQITDDLVYNAVIDQANLDRVLIVRDADDVHRRYTERVNGREQLRYDAISAITCDKLDSISYRHGNVSNEFNRHPIKGYLSGDTTAMLAAAQTDLRHRQEERVALVEEHQRVEDALRSMRAEDQEVQRQITEVQGKLRKYQRALDERREKLNEIEESGRVDTSALESERNELDDALSNLKAQIEVVQAEVQQMTALARDAGSAKRDIEEHKQRITNRLKEAEDRAEASMQARLSEKKKVEILKRKIEEKQLEVTAAEGALEKELMNVDTKRTVAQQQTRELIPEWDDEPLKLGRHESRETIERSVKEMQAKFALAKRDAGLQGYSLEILQERYEKAATELKVVQDTFASLEEKLKALEVSRKERERKWARSLSSSTKVVKKMFDDYASRRGSAGTIDFKHSDGILDIAVQVDSTDANTLANDIKNLSGGERSYVTFCLQLALGHVIECPFRLLDEYDVFMDEASRTLSLEMMQSYALDRPDQRLRQFLILTPHQLAGKVKNGPPLCRIHNMPEPVRLSAHGLQQTTIQTL